MNKAYCKVTGKGCFTAGTLISTDDGEVPIEDIEEGDLVWSEDPDTGEVSLKEVLEVFVKESDAIIHITADDCDEEGCKIDATPNHVFYTEEHGWIPAAYLEEGDGLILQSGEIITVSEISTEHLDKPVPVYNFEVDDYQTYFVSGSDVLVHNMGCKKYHGNDKRSMKTQHGYVIWDRKEKKFAKIGISGGKLNKNGTSRRANSQANKWNKEAGYERYKPVVISKNIKGRKAALEWEKRNADKIKDKYGKNSMTKHKRP